jgi:FKBP-type peptidyl-prolyl cis-trans isomerase
MAVLAVAAVPIVVRAQEVPAAQADPAATGKPVIETDEQKRDYGLGMQMGRNLVNQGIEADVDLLVEGLRDALAGRKPLISEEELRRIMMAFRAELKRARIDNARITAEENFKAGEVFMAENKTKADVVTLPSGLQYKVLKQGAGPVPTDMDTVEVQYRGTLLDGTEFDSSFRNDAPATFVVKGSLPGWRQALLLMPVGSRWELYVPPRLAYGPKGTGLGVGPQATVVFEMELLAIK